MKTIKLALIALLATGLSAATVIAQNATKGKSTKAGSATAQKSPSGQHLKKDGTPDMRYKENKEAAKSNDKAAAKSSDKATAPKSSGTASMSTTSGSKGKSKAKAK